MWYNLRDLACSWGVLDLDVQVKRVLGEVPFARRRGKHQWHSSSYMQQRASCAPWPSILTQMKGHASCFRPPLHNILLAWRAWQCSGSAISRSWVGQMLYSCMATAMRRGSSATWIRTRRERGKRKKKDRMRMGLIRDWGKLSCSFLAG